MLGNSKVAAGLAVLLALTACTSDTTSPTSPDSITPTELATSSTLAMLTSSTTSSTAVVVINDEILDPADLEVVSRDPIASRYIDASGAYSSDGGTDGELNYVKILDGPVKEIADLGDFGVAFESTESNVLWIDSEPPQQLLVGTEDQRLELEGRGTSDSDPSQPVVYYQRHTPGSPLTQESTLRSFNVMTGEVRVIATTGGWEASTRFSYLTGGKAVAIVDADDPGMYILDLDQDRNVLIWDLPRVCPELGKRTYRHATIVEDRIVGARQIFDTHDGVTNAIGFYVLDPATCEETLIESYPWDNGEFYVDGFVGPIVNFKSTPNQVSTPLRAVELDLSGSGNSKSSPIAGFLRPGYIS